MIVASSVSSEDASEFEHRVIFGTAAGGSRSVRLALEHGFKRIDTAIEEDVWYDSKAVGVGIDEYCRSSSNYDNCCNSVMVTTKVPPWLFDGTTETVREAVRREREKLYPNADTKIHELLLHAPRCWQGWHKNCDSSEFTDFKTSWRGMEQAVLIDNTAESRLGVSNSDLRTLAELVDWIDERQRNGDEAAIRPTVLQNYYSPLLKGRGGLDIGAQLRDYCDKQGIQIEGYSLFGTQVKGGFEKLMNDERLIAIGREFSDSESEQECRGEIGVGSVLMSWALIKGIDVIPRSSSRSNIAEAARLIDHGPLLLSVEHVGVIDDLL